MWQSADGKDEHSRGPARPARAMVDLPGLDGFSTW